jgi:predicted nucleotidyltransferase component of viral defense system
MLDFKTILEQYPANLQPFRKSILREYLQYKILQAIFESSAANKLSFIGGTALRIIHGNNRFSEDLDLDNFNLTWTEFEEVIEKVQRFLVYEGFIVEVKNVAKGAYHCYLRFPDLLYKYGLSPIQEEKILIQVDTTTQGYSYKPEIKLLNKFDVFSEVRVAPLSVLLSQKIFAAVQRKRPKGRDFYDITYLAGITKPDMGLFDHMMGISTGENLRKEIATRIAEYDFSKLAQDVSPFLFQTEDTKRVERFREFWEHIEL